MCSLIRLTRCRRRRALGRRRALVRIVTCLRRGRRVQELIIGGLAAAARGCPRVPEDEEGEPVHPQLRNPDGKRDQEQHHVGEHHPVLEAPLPALGIRDLPAPSACLGSGPARRRLCRPGGPAPGPRCGGGPAPWLGRRPVPGGPGPGSSPVPGGPGPGSSPVPGGPGPGSGPVPGGPGPGSGPALRPGPSGRPTLRPRPGGGTSIRRPQPRGRPGLWFRLPAVWLPALLLAPGFLQLLPRLCVGAPRPPVLRLRALLPGLCLGTLLPGLCLRTLLPRLCLWALLPRLCLGALLPGLCLPGLGLG